MGARSITRKIACVRRALDTRLQSRAASTKHAGGFWGKHMADQTILADWIAVDWGTSRLRAWAMERDGLVLARASSDKGMGGLASDGFEPALLDLISPWLRPGGVTQVIACGMVGARQGWIEAAYGEVPCPPLDAQQCVRAPASDPRLDVRIIPGLCQMDPADVMRGEETQIAGVLSLHSGFEGRICLPGTHTKWVDLRGGRVTRFRTMMTGEVFALLSEQSVLRHSMGESWDDGAFAEAVVEAHSNPALLSGALFGLRAGSLLTDLSGDAARARLSGLLIGAELAAVDPDPGPVALVGAEGARAVYARALGEIGVETFALEAEEVTLSGLKQAWAALEQEPST